MTNQQHPPYVTTTSGMRGRFAVLMVWNDEDGGFYEPMNTGETCATHDECVGYAKAWAEAEEVEYRA